MSKALSTIVKQTLVSTRHSSCKQLPAVIKKQVVAIVPVMVRFDQPLPDPLALMALAEYEESECAPRHNLNSANLCRDQWNLQKK